MIINTASPAVLSLDDDLVSCVGFGVTTPVGTIGLAVGVLVVGASVGSGVGDTVGVPVVGASVGALVGASVGVPVVGESVGASVGAFVGTPVVGAGVGASVGSGVGEGEGASVGAGVGALVSVFCLLLPSLSTAYHTPLCESPFDVVSASNVYWYIGIIPKLRTKQQM